jgi:hypothetical protein
MRPRGHHSALAVSTIAHVARVILSSWRGPSLLDVLKQALSARDRALLGNPDHPPSSLVAAIGSG